MEFMKEEFKMEKDMKIEREKSLIEQAFIFSFPLVLMDITKEVSTNTVKPVKYAKCRYAVFTDFF